MTSLQLSVSRNLKLNPLAWRATQGFTIPTGPQLLAQEVHVYYIYIINITCLYISYELIVGRPINICWLCSAFTTLIPFPNRPPRNLSHLQMNPPPSWGHIFQTSFQKCNEMILCSVRSFHGLSCLGKYFIRTLAQTIDLQFFIIPTNFNRFFWTQTVFIYAAV